MEQDTPKVIPSSSSTTTSTNIFLTPLPLEQLAATLTEFTGILGNLREEISTLNSQVEFLHNGMQTLELTCKHQAELIHALGGLKKFSHLSPPEPYDGSPDKAKSFLNSLR